MARRIAPLALVALAAFATAVVGAADAGRSPICTRGNTSVEVDPRGLLPLTGVNPISPAAAAALRVSTPASRPQVVGAQFAVADQQRGPQAKFACGRRVWQRTVVVYVRERAFLPAMSASSRVYFVGRFRSGYRVWQVVK